VAKFGFVLREPRSVGAVPASLRLNVVFRGLWAVVPPAGIPEALKQTLGVVLMMAGDEVNVAAKGFVEEAEDSVARVGGGQRFESSRKVGRKIKGLARFVFGFEPAEFIQKVGELAGAASCN
jgi:hypothetical protein